MIDINRMIGRLVQLVQDTHLPLGKGCRREYRIAEMVLRHHLRTGEGKEDAPFLYLLESLLVQPGIALQGVMQGTTVLGERRRVEDDEVVIGTCLLQILEGILTICLMTGIAREVQPTFSRVSAIAFAELSTECTSSAPPRMA